MGPFTSPHIGELLEQGTARGRLWFEKSYVADSLKYSRHEIKSETLICETHRRERGRVRDSGGFTAGPTLARLAADRREISGSGSRRGPFRGPIPPTSG